MTKSIRWRDFGAALFVLAMGIGFLAWAKTYPPRTASVPVLVAWLTIALAVIDAIAQTETLLGRLLRRLITAENVIEWTPDGDTSAAWTKSLVSLVWVFAYLGALLLLGFLVATPVYIFLYMLLHGKRSVKASALGAAITTLFIWVTFAVAFRYPLYPGLLFGGT